MRLLPGSVRVPPSTERSSRSGFSRLVTRAAPFFERRFERALHQAEPVPVDVDLVLRVDGSDGVFEVLNRRHRGLENDVLDARGIGLSHGMGRVDLDLDVKPVVLQENLGERASGLVVSHESRGVHEAGDVAVSQGGAKLAPPAGIGQREARDVGVASAIERHALVEQLLREGDHPGAAHRVEGAGSRRAVRLRDRVGSVERVVEAPPAGVRGV